MGKNTESKIFQLICRNLHQCVEFEYRFHPKRMWRFDIAWPDVKVAVEIDGGVWIGGRHSGGIGQIRDNEKINTAQSMGWRVFRFVPGDVKSGYFVRAMGSVFQNGEFPPMPTPPKARRKKRETAGNTSKNEKAGKRSHTKGTGEYRRNTTKSHLHDRKQEDGNTK